MTIKAWEFLNYMINKLIDFIKSEKFKKLFKFGCIGVINTLVDYGTFALCHYLFGFDKFISQFLAVVVAATNSYFLNNNITFKKTKQKGFTAYAKFMSVNFVSIGMSLVMMFIFSNHLGLKPIIAKIPISICTILLSFTVYDKLVFTKRK